MAAVQALPYGRASGRTPEAVLASGQGTCSTKHYLLQALIEERWPDLTVDVVHRVYRLTPDDAAPRFGRRVASLVPAGGLSDVHTYLVIELDSGAVTVDVTFPGTPAWDGRTSMPIQCGEGTDYPCGTEPDAHKAVLVAQHCDPATREPFIAALSSR